MKKRIVLVATLVLIISAGVILYPYIEFMINVSKIEEKIIGEWNVIEDDAVFGTITFDESTFTIDDLESEIYTGIYIVEDENTVYFKYISIYGQTPGFGQSEAFFHMYFHNDDVLTLRHKRGNSDLFLVRKSAMVQESIEIEQKEEIEKTQNVDASELNINDYTDVLGLTMEEFINRHGNPIHTEEIYSEYLEGNEVTFYYDFGSAVFIPGDTVDSLLVGLTIESSDIEGPSGLRVGGDFEDILHKHPYNNYDNEYIAQVLGRDKSEEFEGDIEVIYIQGNEMNAALSIGTIGYDEFKQVMNVAYVENYRSGGFTSLVYEIGNNKIIKIEIIQGYM